MTTKHHVQGHCCHTLPDVPAVEQVGKVIADITGAATFWSTPGVVRTALELGHESGHAGLGFLEVVVVFQDLEGDVCAISGGTLADIASPALIHKVN